MECIKCKKEIPDESIFCMYCGKKQAPAVHGVKKRGNGQGTVYKMPSGTWAAEITLGYYMQDGKRKRKKSRKYGFRTKKEAVEYIATLKQSPKKEKFITMFQLWELFQTKKETLSKSKRTAYNIAWKKIHAEIEYRQIDELTVPELQAITDKYGTSYYTKRDIKNLLSHLYQIAIRDDYTDKNRAQFIQLPELQSQEREVMTKQEIELLWNDYQKEPSAITAQMLTMLYTGIRPGELLTIKVENINLDEQYMIGGIKTTKGKNRKIIIPDKIKPLLSWLMETGKKGLIAYYPSDVEFYDAWKQKRSQLNIRDVITPYCCRHTYITRLTTLKVSPAMLQELAGHEDYDTTLEYTHLSIAERLQEVNRLD